ncbi:hypothetical protein AC249_AIPGENE13224 [Exaiptasia diaphana]|nr:hypothetical protein AC249_AIPGENE13224 [Exaiptasia diaphana]
MKMANKQGGFTDILTDIRNCTTSLTCNTAMLDYTCKLANSTGFLVDCEFGCCEGDLCNSGGPMPTLAPRPTGPSGFLVDCEFGCCEGDLCNSGGPMPTLAPRPTGPSGTKYNTQCGTLS